MLPGPAAKDGATPDGIRLGYRLLFAFIGLLAGEATMAVLVAGRSLWLYFMIAAAIGWAFVGLPVLLPLPARVVSRVPWPVVLLAGGFLGPLALLAILLTAEVLHGPNWATFSWAGLVAGTETLWPTASLVSTVSVTLYWALVRRTYRQLGVR